jgi:phenylpropionate dioxygenase-like ring-hydroxylating dioxygenase large terminal subunit
MPFLRNCWYQAGWVSELDAGTLARTIAGIPLVFFRSEGGRICALLDRCPHRFAPLSAGRLEKGVITCGYHGLVFDGTGRCVHNPHGAAVSAIRVESFAAEERHQALWVWTGARESADPAKIPALNYIDSTPSPALIAGYLPTGANYELMTDNILDLSHADYLHANTLGGMMTSSRAKHWLEGDDVLVEWDAVDCIPPPAFRGIVPPPNRADLWFEVRWTAPAVMSLRSFVGVTGTPRAEERMATALHSMTPETEQRTHYFYCVTRRFLLDDAEFSAGLRQTVEQAFGQEDKPMLEKQQMRIGRQDFWSLDPILLGVDAPAVKARRVLKRLMDSEHTD